MNTRPAFLKFFCILFACFYSLSAIAQEEQKTREDAITDALFFDAIRASIDADYPKAEQLLLAFTRKKPEVGAGWYNLARLKSQTRELTSAEKYIRKAISMEPDNQWYQDALADILVRQAKYEAAARVYGQLAKAHKRNADYLISSAVLYQKLGMYPEALNALNELEQSKGEYEELLQRKQELYLQMNDVAGAVKVARRLVALYPNEARFYAQLAEIYNNNQRPDEGAKVLQEMETKFPNDPIVQLSLANNYREKGDTAAYEDYVRQAITNKTLDPESQLTLLAAYAQEVMKDTSRLSDVIEMAGKISSQRPDDANVLALYGDLLMMRRQTGQAAEAYKKAVQVDPSKYNAWQQLLFAYIEPTEADSLIKYSEKAMRVFPNQLLVHYLNGIGYFNKKEYTKAIKAINRALDIADEDDDEMTATMYTLLGDIYNATKDYTKSDSSYEAAMRINPNDATLLNNYAYYLSVRKVRLKEAEKMSKRSLDLRPGEATFLDTYGWILFQEGKYAEAKKYIQQAIDSSGDEVSGTLWEHLGDAEMKLGNSIRAVELWQKAKEKGGTDDLQKLNRKISEKKFYE